MTSSDIALKFDLRKCVQCGKCTASCPTGRESNLRTRALVFRANSSDVSAERELWLCTTCYTCQERCPKGVKITDAIIELRNLAAEKGNYPSIHLTAIKGLRDTSDGFPITPEVSKIRSLLGLSIEPFDVAHSAEEREKFRKLFQSLRISVFLEEKK
ncbi:MAG: 4Fe-4S dicluster domain-containing protein [candidate division NC10 bacterium]